MLTVLRFQIGVDTLQRIPKTITTQRPLLAYMQNLTYHLDILMRTKQLRTRTLGYDANYPYAKFPISVQASSGLFFRDYYYQNSGDRTVFVGGGWITVLCWFVVLGICYVSVYDFILVLGFRIALKGVSMGVFPQ